MKKEYQIKNYTQGHLRIMIKSKLEQWMSYRNIQSELWIGSLATINKWNKEESIESKSSAPNLPSRKYEFKDLYILYAVRKYLELKGDDCQEILEEDYWINMKRWSVFYYLKLRWMTKKDKRTTKKFKEYEPWYLHVDISYWPTIDGKKCYIYVAIDRATRLMYLEIHEDKKAETAGKFFKEANSFFPFDIEKVLTDNGKEFTLKNHLGKKDLKWAFDKICSEFEIEHRLTKPYTPQTNWMVEKCNDTIKSNTVWITKYNNREEMISHILEFMFFYNLFRRHWWVVREWKWKTPFDAYSYYYKNNSDKFNLSPDDFKTKLYNMAKEKKLEIFQRRNR